MDIPFFRPEISGNEIKYIQEVLESGWLTSGNFVQKFEDGLTEYTKSKHAVALCSCTAALHLALRISGISSGDKVFVPTMTFTASAEVITYMNAIPVFLDIDPNTGLITREIVEHAYRHHPEVKALIVVHFAGQTAEMLTEDKNGIVDFCNFYGIKVIEDCAHSLGGKRKNQHSGTFGDVGCFSFYANKCITTGEGGALITDNDEYFEIAMKLRTHGMSKAIKNRKHWEYEVDELGYKYNMSDINAAIGVAQLEKVELMRASREAIAAIYSGIIEKYDFIQTLDLEVEFSEHSWHIFPVLINSKTSNIRDKVYQSLTNQGIGLSVHYIPLHMMNAYKKYVDNDEHNFKGADSFFRKGLSLPIYPKLSKSTAEKIIKELIFTVARFS